MIKDLIRKTLITLHLDLTQNLRYDRLTDKIMVSHLRPQSN